MKVYLEYYGWLFWIVARKGRQINQHLNQLCDTLKKKSLKEQKPQCGIQLAQNLYYISSHEIETLIFQKQNYLGKNYQSGISSFLYSNSCRIPSMLVVETMLSRLDDHNVFYSICNAERNTPYSLPVGWLVNGLELAKCNHVCFQSINYGIVIPLERQAWVALYCSRLRHSIQEEFVGQIRLCSWFW